MERDKAIGRMAARLQHQHRPTPWRDRLGFAVIGGIVACGLSGAAGGGPPDRVTTGTAAVEAAVETSGIVRGGSDFPVEIRVRPRRPVARLVIALPDGWASRIGIEDVRPRPDGQSRDADHLLWEYRALDAGQPFRVRFRARALRDRPGTGEGRIEVRDGARLLAFLPLRLSVLV